MQCFHSQVMFLFSEKVKQQFHDQSELCLIWSYVIFGSCTVSAKSKSSGATNVLKHAKKKTKSKHEMKKTKTKKHLKI